MGRRRGSGNERDAEEEDEEEGTEPFRDREARIRNLFLRSLTLTRSLFLDASSHLYKRPCPSVGPSIRPLVGRSVMLLSKWMKNCLSRILNNFVSAK